MDELKIRNRLIEHICFTYKPVGKLVMNRLGVEDAAALFDFYFGGLTERSREFFPPYPLFSPGPSSIDELSQRITDWQQEDDWTFLKLIMGEQLIGVCLLKRYKTLSPQYGLAVRMDYENMGLGFLLLTIVKEQARSLELEKLVATIAPENMASIQMHKWYGFRKTGQSVPHYTYKESVRVIDRYDVEMILEF